MSREKDWIFQTNIYEVNVRQYTPEGTFRAFAEHLPRLKDMGVETLWFMPVTPIAQLVKKGSLGSYYACSDYVSINPEFGTLDDFTWLVKTCHGMGFRVIIDWVANHTGWDHVWTKQHPEWYQQDERGRFLPASGMDDIIELDFSHPELRAAMTEAMQFWVERCDIDGFRCDLAFWVELDFWLEAIPKLNKIKPLFWLAEMDPLEFPDYMEVFDAAYSWSWMHQTQKWYQQNLKLSTLWQVLHQYESAPGLQVWFTSNHDENSWNGTEFEKYGEAAFALAVHSFTWPGIPLMYSGQELPNKKRLLFFDKDQIEWDGIGALHELYKTLMRFHREHASMDARAEVFRLYTSSEANIMAYFRKKGKAESVVLLNLSPHALRFDLLSGWVKNRFTELFTGDVHDFSSSQSFSMKPWEYRIYILDEN